MLEVRSISKFRQHPEGLEASKWFLAFHAQATLRSSSSSERPFPRVPQSTQLPILHALQAHYGSHRFRSPKSVPRSGRDPVPNPGCGRAHPPLVSRDLLSPSRSTNS
ncbi:hypothetical protein ACFX1S_031583 [Malus domestica]